jgi:predicted peptidase
LGTKHPEIWAGLAPIAPAINRLMSEDSLEKIEETPVIVVQGDADRVVPVEGSRRWVAKMKELEMTHVYIEVAGGDHMTVAWREMPKIFDFFDKHRRAPKERPVR